MFVTQIEEAIAAASPSAFPALNRAIWAGLSSGAVSEEDAGRLAEAIHARQVIAKAASGPVGGSRPLASVYPPRRVQRPPVRSEAIERRRRLAASGPLPPALAARFTTSEAAVMRIIGDTCRDHGRCVLPIDGIAARAGVSRTTVQNAIRLAVRLGMLNLEERRQHRAPSLPNRLTVVDREWRQWLERGPKGRGGGFRNLSATETRFSSEGAKSIPSSSNQEGRPRFTRPVVRRQT